MNAIHKLKLGAAAWLLSAVLTLCGLLLRGPLINTTADAQSFARSAASPGNAVAETILPLSLVVQILAFLGLYVFLAGDGRGWTAFWGMVFSVFGNGLFLPFAGIFAFVMPVVGRLYLEGRLEVIQVAELTLGPGPGFVYLIASAVTLTLGAVLFGMAMWSTDRLPRGLPAIYVAQAFLLSFGASIGYPFEITGGVLLLIFSLVMAGKMWRSGGRAAERRSSHPGPSVVK